MKLIFDYDDVIVDSSKIKAALFKVLADRGFPNAARDYALWRSSGKVFSYRDFLVSVDSSLGFPENKELQDSLYNNIIAVSGSSVKPEILEIMKRYRPENCYIVTNGTEEDQMQKIRESIGEDSVRQIYVVSGSKRDVIKEICLRHKDEEVIFIDDKAHYLNDIHGEGYENLKTVLFNEHGLENLKAEIEESLKEERERQMYQPMNLPPQPPQGLH